MAEKIPTDIKLRTKSKLLELEYQGGQRYSLSCEYLRVHSPSAEVRGHGTGQEVLQVGKQATVDIDVATGEGKGVDVGAVDDGEGKFRAGFVTVGHQALAHAVDVGL